MSVKLNNIRKRSVFVGVFWCINQQIYGERESLNVNDNALEGMVDSHLEHWRIWESGNHAFDTSILRQDYEYFAFPRGRVLYDVSASKYIVYCDQALMDLDIKKKIADFFEIPIVEILWKTDIHYSTDENTILGLFDDI